VRPEAMEGQSFYGAEAAATGLVDAVGSREDALSVLGTLADMNGRLGG